MKQAGERLGPYEIVEFLGAGAMAEVFRARDVRLQREVALKVLSGAASSEPAFLGRFEREARTASAIDHPNVVTVHDVGRLETTAWIAMELVDGRTLREVLDDGPMPMRRALAVAAQIADGMAAAHERGVIHRDLKPANIKITPDGLVKILDFGLAKIDSVSSQAIEGNLTVDGFLIGTVAYMSPEQAAFKPPDFRSDQFSLGTILFEMLSGRLPFRGDSAAQTMAAIIHSETPPVPDVDAAVRVPLHWILDRCHAKDPQDRYASTRDLARDLHELAELVEHPEPVTPVPEPGPPVVSAGLKTVVVPLALALAVLSGGYLGHFLVRRPVPSFEQITFGRGHVVAARFVPGTSTTVYSAGWEGRPFSLYRKDAQGSASQPVALPAAGSAGWLQAAGPDSVLVVTEPQILLPGRPLGTLSEGPLAGGTPRERAEHVQGADWGPGRKETAIVREEAGRMVLEFPEGNRVFDTSGWISSPRISRSGALVAFIEHEVRADDRGRVVVVDRNRRVMLQTELWASAKGVAWNPARGKEDEVWYASSPGEELRAIWAVRFGGKPRVVYRAPGPLALYDIAENGDALVARETRYICISALLPDGTTRELTWDDSSLVADLSDDGRTMLFTEFGESGGLNYSTFLLRIGDPMPKKLGRGFAKALSPDRQSALSLITLPEPRLMRLPTGAGLEQEIRHHDIAAYHAAGFLPDGRRILVAAEGAAAKGSEAQVRLYVQDLAGGAARVIGKRAVDADHYQGFPVSPDGKWVAVVDHKGAFGLQGIDHDEWRPIPWLGRGMLPVRWTSDGRVLFVYRPDQVPARVLRVDLQKQTVQPWLSFAPPDVTGVHIFPAVRLSADGRTCVYSYARYLTVLYRATGLK